MKRSIFHGSLVFAICLILLPLSSVAITVKDTKGRTMEISVISYTKSSGNVKIKRDDGTVFNVNLNLFDSDSQSKILAAAPKARAELLVKPSVGKRRKQQGNSSYMKDQTVTASIYMKNVSRDIEFMSGKVTVILVARQTRRYSERDQDYGKVLAKQSFNVSIKPSEDTKYECKPIITSYDSDRDSSNVGGWEYYGYMVIVQEKDESIHTVETSIGSIKKVLEETPEAGKIYLKLQVGQMVKKDLSKK